MGTETLDGVPTEVLGARIGALASRMARATYRWLAMIAEFDAREGWSGAGIKSCAHWLAWTCSMSPGAAREHVRVARALQHLPLVSAEMAEGRLSYAKVRELTRMTNRAIAEAEPLPGAEPTPIDEPALVELARTATASQLARSVRAYRRAAGDHGRQEWSRKVSWYRADDGSVVISARLPSEEGAVILAAMEAARDDLWRGAEDREPPDQADVLVHLARGYLAAAPKDRSGEDRTLVVVHVSAEHLDAHADETRSRGNVSPPTPPAPRDVCEIAGVGGIEPDTARRLACDATLVGIIRGAGGVTLAHGRKRRLVSEAQRRALQIRDGGCRFPACQRTSHLDAHHVTPWSHGGGTDMSNLILLCRFHHVACHEGGIRIVETSRSTRRKPEWVFTTAQGELLGGQRPSDGSAQIPWKSDGWILNQALDGSKGWRDPEASNIRPLWAGERFSLADTVSVLFAIAAKDGKRTSDKRVDRAA